MSKHSRETLLPNYVNGVIIKSDERSPQDQWWRFNTRTHRWEYVYFNSSNKAGDHAG